ncbi:hypothetical protein J5Y04_13170 [Kitasatospora sp. RG8]|uniref:DUF6368 family protein n=1 Tax=Kitasatospora sp. RG8 TaxID=2820815 RepID=UPI001AE072E1|nr:DUF6368 family protein [Kitasatospora sp. RG8]MBP0450499.1 hypothetical protein [Kitasatospora sp. RG8]
MALGHNFPGDDMAGPAVGLWLFEPREFGDIVDDVVPWLEGFCEPVETRLRGDLDFWVRDGSAVGLPAFEPNSTGVFFLSEDEELPAEDEDYSAFSQPPAQGLILGAGCSGPTNHLVLGHLTLALAERLGALIDFDGLLSYPTPREDTGDEALLERARALVGSLPGRVAEVSYDTWGGGRWFRHVGDVEFLSAWLQHPGFHLVK